MISVTLYTLMTLSFDDWRPSAATHSPLLADHPACG
jgi:hypothetical protein